MLYRPFQFYLDFAHGDAELATRIEQLVMQSTHQFSQSLLDTLYQASYQEPNPLIAHGIKQSILITTRHSIPQWE